MNFWQKVLSNFKGSFETISEKTTELSHIAKLRWELFNTQKAISRKYNELGGKVYQLHVDGNENKLDHEIKPFFDDLGKLNKELQMKNEQLEKLTTETVDSHQLREFKKDLEKGGGSIEHIIIEEQSPFLNKKLMDIKLPKNVLLSAIVRKNEVIIPDGETIFELGDKVTLIGDKEEVDETLASIAISQ